MKKTKIACHHNMTKIFFIVILFATGCTFIYEQPLHDLTLSSPNDKVDLNIKLIMTDEFRNKKWTQKSRGDTFILPIGDNLVHNSVKLIKNVFTDPVILEEGKKPQNNTDAEYIMKPKVVFIEQTFGVTAFSKAKTSIGVEWTLSNLSGNAVWVETVKGTGLGKAGNAFTQEEHQKKRLKKALQDLFEKSQKAMLTSRLLRSLK